MKFKKNLGIVFNSLDIGGIERKIIDLVKLTTINYKQINLHVYLKHNQGPFLNQLPPEIHIYSPPQLNKYVLNCIFPFWLAYKLIRLNSINIIAFGNYSAISTLIAKVLLIGKAFKVTVSEDSSVIEQIKMEKLFLLRLILIKLLYPIADKIIVLSKTGKTKLLSLCKIKPEKIHLIENWLPLDYQRQKIPKKIYNFAFIARFEPQKDPIRFLKIIQKLQTIRPSSSIMVGYGTLQSQIENYIETNNLKTILHPATTDPKKYYLESEFLVLSSRHEGFPLTILEAIACNCIPILPNLDELRHFFDKYESYIFFDNEKQACDKIMCLKNHQVIKNSILEYYRNKVYQNQKLNISKTINLILSD